jgi:hypothetical protein
MPEQWTTMPAGEVAVGATIRLADGRELEVTRIEEAFFGMPELRAFIEDTPRQWFKAPVGASAEVEVRTAP